MAIAFERYRISVEEYHRMVEAGVFQDDRRIELINGQLIETVAPIHPPHTYSTRQLVAAFFARFASRAAVYIQMPVTLPPNSEPEPDVALARQDAKNYVDRHPGPGDLYVVIEVADSTLLMDRRLKVPLYARAGVKELWLVNIPDDRIEVYRDPVGRRYQQIATAQRGDTIEMLAFPGETFAVDDILPPPQSL
jgi:Uma2 family endonuclease